MPPSALIIRRANDQGTATEVKNYECCQLEGPPGAPLTGNNKESTMLRDLTNERQLKNSETCPE